MSLKWTLHLNTYFPVFHPFELGLKQSYPLLDEGRTRRQKIILFMVGENLKILYRKNLNDRLADKAHRDLCLIHAGNGAVRFWLPLFREPPM